MILLLNTPTFTPQARRRWLRPPLFRPPPPILLLILGLQQIAAPLKPSSLQSLYLAWTIPDLNPLLLLAKSLLSGSVFSIEPIKGDSNYKQHFHRNKNVSETPLKKKSWIASCNLNLLHLVREIRPSTDSWYRYIDLANIFTAFHVNLHVLFLRAAFRWHCSGIAWRYLLILSVSFTL